MEKDDKRIKDLVNKLMTADSLEQAPMNFTDSVMSKIEAISTSKTIVYKPLIPKYILWLVGTGFIAVVGYILFKQPTGNSTFLDRFNLPDLSFNPFEGLSFELSNTLMYAVVLFAIMLSIQIPILKQYFNNRMSF
ncbi:hypothetical protein [Winogradskyella sp. PG-2]|uniref:hypothetical protein n=1 Tax=Winogradskyella sp. PG-2 TaxID=754409 RepID=UPI0004588763|nr:hypothetical protein [Winogradskyella sp. PG-2]BAO76703.1 hypothetical protein WPG_2473 [Winogradskyella sp. PG-2]